MCVDHRESTAYFSWRESAAERKAAIDVRNHPKSILAGAIGAAICGAFRAGKPLELDVSAR